MRIAEDAAALGRRVFADRGEGEDGDRPSGGTGEVIGDRCGPLRPAGMESGWRIQKVFLKERAHVRCSLLGPRAIPGC